MDEEAELERKLRVRLANAEMLYINRRGWYGDGLLTRMALEEVKELRVKLLLRQALNRLRERNVGRWPMTVLVASSDGKGQYKVVFRNERDSGSCNCKGFSYRRSCRHLEIGAAEMKERVRSDTYRVAVRAGTDVSAH